MIGLGIGASVLLGGVLGWLALVLAGAAWALAWWAGASRWTALPPILLAVALGAWRVHGHADTVPSLPPALLDGGPVTGLVANGPVTGAYGQRFVVRSEDVRVCVEAPDFPRLLRGDTVMLTGVVVPLAEAPTWLAPTARARGCAGTMSASGLRRIAEGTGFLHAADRIRRELTRILQRAAPGNRGALLAGLVTGDDAQLSAQARSAFYATGTSHITAVSGSNLAIIGFAVLWVGRAGPARSRRPQVLPTVAGVTGYAIMVGGAPPVTRAAAVASIAVLASLVGRRADLLTISLLVAALEIVVRPYDLVSLSFQLSTAASIAIILLAPARRFGGRASWALLIVIATLAAQLGTLPLLARTVGVPSPWAIPANIAIAPIVALAFPLSVIAALGGLISQNVADALVWPAAHLSAAILAIVEYFAEFPGTGTFTVGDDSPALAMLIIFAGATFLLLSREARGGVQRVLTRATNAHGARAWIPLSVGSGLLWGIAVAAAVR